jgi:hypothetical protein
MAESIIYECSACCVRSVFRYFLFVNICSIQQEQEMDQTIEDNVDETEDAVLENKKWADNLIRSLIAVMTTYQVEFDSSPTKKLVWHKIVKQLNKVLYSQMHFKITTI